MKPILPTLLLAALLLPLFLSFGGCYSTGTSTHVRVSHGHHPSVHHRHRRYTVHHVSHSRHVRHSSHRTHVRHSHMRTHPHRRW